MLLETFLEMYFLWRMCLFSYVNVQKVYAVFCKCLNFYSTLLENLTDYVLAFRPFPSIWLNFTSHRALQKHYQSHTACTAKSAQTFQTVYVQSYIFAQIWSSPNLIWSPPPRAMRPLSSTMVSKFKLFYDISTFYIA